MNIATAKNRILHTKKSKWTKVSLADVCEIDPSKKELNGIDKNSEVSFGMMAALGEHKRNFSPIETKRISEVTKGGYTYFRENDVLLAKMTPCFENGKSGIALNLKNGIGFGSTEFYVLRSSNKILPDWIYFIISSEKFLEEGKLSLVGTTGRRRLIKHYVESFQIPLPTIKEQTQIVELFQNIETTIEQAEQQKESLVALRKALCNGLTNINPSFGDLLNKKNCRATTFGKITDCVEKHDRERKGISHFIGLEHVAPENLKITTWGNIANGTTFTKRFSKGDVLFGKRRAYLKKVAIADFNGVCSSDILVLRARKNMILPELLPFYASTEAFIQHAVRTSAGSLSPRTKWKDLSSFELAIPDMKTQKKIVDVLLQIQDVLGLIKSQIVILSNLKQRLLNELLE